MAKHKREPIILTDEHIKYINSVPSKYRGCVRKALEGKSLASAVKAKCLDCCCWQHSEAADCRVPMCALYFFNPYRRRLQDRVSIKQTHV